MDFEYHEDKQEQRELRAATPADDQYVGRILLIIAAACAAILLLILLTVGSLNSVFVPAG